MAVYKKIRKGWLKELTKKQRKEFKDYTQDVADEMLRRYAGVIRLNGLTGMDCVGMYKPIANSDFALRIYIQVIKD